MILGITGGTGCGKTTLLHCVAERGGLVLDCDEIYHELLETDPMLLAAIEAGSPARWKMTACSARSWGSWCFPIRRPWQT